MCSAYRNADGTDVIVVINYGHTPETITINGVRPSAWSLYRTSDRENESLAFIVKSDNLDSVIIPPRSITTIVSDRQP